MATPNITFGTPDGFKEIAEKLSITQQAVSDHLDAVKNRLWKSFRKNRDFRRAGQNLD